MKQLIGLVTIVVLVLAFGAQGVASAQNPSGSNRGVGRSAASFGGQQFGYLPSANRRNIYSKPTVSPYLNLLRGGSEFTGVPNYQTLVRPEMQQGAINRQQANQINRLQQQETTLNRQVADPSRPIRQTGHPTQFMNLSERFGTLPFPRQ